MPRIKKSENIQKIEEPLTNYKVNGEAPDNSKNYLGRPKINIEAIEDNSSSGSSEIIEKPKKVLSEKQKLAFEKARLKRQENIQTIKLVKEKEDKEFQKMKDEKLMKKELKDKKKKDLEIKKLELENDSSDSEQSIVIVKKKKKPKKKVIYVDDDDDDEQKDNNIVIINKMQPHKAQPKVRPQPIGRFI